MTKSIYVCTLLIFGTILILSACESEKVVDDPNPTPQAEYAATDADFENFRNWTVIKQLDRALSDDGRAHTDAARTIWVKQANVSRSQNGQYPNGTIFVKGVQGGYGIVAMVKRGAFNSSHQGWEWFRLDSAGKITSRNSSNLCNSCHAQEKSKIMSLQKISSLVTR